MHRWKFRARHVMLCGKISRVVSTMFQRELNKFDRSVWKVREISMRSFKSASFVLWNEIKWIVVRSLSAKLHQFKLSRIFHCHWNTEIALFKDRRKVIFSDLTLGIRILANQVQLQLRFHVDRDWSDINKNSFESARTKGREIASRCTRDGEREEGAAFL